MLQYYVYLPYLYLLVSIISTCLSLMFKMMWRYRFVFVVFVVVVVLILMLMKRHLLVYAQKIHALIHNPTWKQSLELKLMMKHSKSRRSKTCPQWRTNSILVRHFHTLFIGLKKNVTFFLYSKYLKVQYRFYP